MFSSPRTVSAVLVATLLIAACGSDDSTSSTTAVTVAAPAVTVADSAPQTTPETTPGTSEVQTEDTTSSTDVPSQDIAADTAAAEAAVLTLANLPEGWAEAAADDGAMSEVDGRLAECLGVDSLTSPDAQAMTSNFTNSDGTLVVYEGVGVQAAELDSRTVIARMTNPDVLDCFAAAYAELGAGALSTGAIAEGAEIGEVTATRLAVAPVGDSTQAIRVVIPVTTDGIQAQLTVDQVLVRSGRSLAVITFEGRTEGGTAVETIDEITAAAAANLTS